MTIVTSDGGNRGCGALVPPTTAAAGHLARGFAERSGHTWALRCGWLLIAALAAAWPHCRAQAQVVRGVVLDATTTAPIVGAMVVVVDSTTGQVAGRCLTGPKGLFVTQVRHPGRYRARVDRIGYESVTTAAFDTPPEGTFQRILVAIHPVRLAGLHVSGARRCEVRPEVGEATATVWGEARKALEAARWTATSGRYRYTLLQFSRRLDSRGRVIISEERTFLRGRGQTPYASVPAEQLAKDGYVRQLRGGRLSYYAPDASVLLSAAFVDTHCMRVTTGGDSLIALEFAPVKGRKLTEIRGTMWLDARTAELRRVDYRYLNLNRGRATGEAGGELSFTHVPTGAWFVSDWHIRMPLLERARPAGYRRGGYEDKGGTVWSIVDSAGANVYHAVTGSVRGQVLDSLGAPMPGVAVVPRGINALARSGAGGTFVLTGLPEGLIRLDVVAPNLDTLGVTTLDRALVTTLSKGGSATINVHVPGLAERLGGACGGKRPSETTIVLGRVLAPGAHLEGDTVWIGRLSGSRRFHPREQSMPPGGTGTGSSWQHIKDTQWWEATLDRRGVFMFCDVPVPGEVRARARVDGRSVQTDLDLVRGGDGVTVMTLVFPAVNEGR